MKRTTYRRATWVGAALFFTALLVGAIAPLGRPVPTYTRVDAVEGLSIARSAGAESRPERLPLEHVHSTTWPDFVVYEDTLYLKTQEIRSSLLLVTFVKRIDWSDDQMKRLVARNPEIGAYVGIGKGTQKKTTTGI